MMSAALPDDSRVLEEFGVAKKRISEIFNDIDQQMEAVQVIKTYLFYQLIISYSSMCSTKLKFRSSYRTETLPKYRVPFNSKTE